MTTATEISAAELAEVALTREEYDLAVEKLGRHPTRVELGIIGALWSEHCGYKTSKPLLKRLPTTGLLRWKLLESAAPWPRSVPVQPTVPDARIDGLRATIVGHASVLIQVAGSRRSDRPSLVEPGKSAAFRRSAARMGTRDRL